MSRHVTRFLSAAVLLTISTILIVGESAAQSSSHVITVQFIDSATGHKVQPTEVHVNSPDVQVGIAGGKAKLTLPEPRRGFCHLEVHAPGYRSMSGTVALEEGSGRLIRFLLEPIEPPPELQPEFISSLRRSDATLFLGFVVDNESGEPLANVRVSSAPSSVETWTDARGFFQLAIPLPPEAEVASRLSFEAPGYISEEHQSLELWPNGDWTYPIRLNRGAGKRTENDFRRQPRATHPRAISQPAALESIGPQNAAAVKAPSSASITSASNLTIRVPRTIRVLLTNGTIDYVSLELYCRRSLPREWFASWNSYAGGSNSLQAGAVAVRTYAVGFINYPRASDHDICATTACQVYGSSTSTSTDNAVNQTAGFLMVNSSGSIPRGLTEYSSENNQLGMPCGDGYTAPSGGCLSDPVCTGEPEFGHGRGMCQWGSVKWATGLKFPGNNFSDTTSTNGQLRQNWVWILEHYYPNLVLLQGTPLLVGDDVKVIGTNSLAVRMCDDGGITNGMGCPQTGTRTLGATGSIIDGPVQVLSDGFGFTWWKIQWSDNLIGWSPENWLERPTPVPAAPSNLVAMVVSSSRIDLNWSDNSSIESGFKVEQASSTNGPWIQILVVGSNVTSLAVTNLNANNTYSFRVRAFNFGSDSDYSNIATATTPDVPPLLAPIGDVVIQEGQTLTFTAAAAAPETVQLVTGFESFAPGSPNGTILFRQPTFSGSTASFLDGSPNSSVVTSNFPAGNGNTRALQVNWSFNTNAWLRLTTFGASTLPNPVIDFTKKLRLDIYADRALRIGVGLRETTNASGTPLGSDGGTLGAIEWSGVTNRIGVQPQPTRLIAAGAWTTLTFDLPVEPVWNFAGGNGVLSTASGLGVLEHLAFVPAAGIGAYNVYLDNFAVVKSKRLIFSLEPGAPSGASINPTNGVFTWNPMETQGPSTNLITVRVTDDGMPAQSDTETFTVIVNETNQAPILAAISNQIIHAGMTVLLTNSATDADIPANTLSFSLTSSPAGAAIDQSTGVLIWATSDALAGTTNNFTVRVTDNGAPPLSNARTFAVVVRSRPALRAATGSSPGSVTLTWDAILGKTYRVQYKNNLNENLWNDLGPPVVANESMMTLEDTPGASQRFYRIAIDG